MTNLKKTLAVVLAFAMILSMGAISTFAYSDVEAGTKTDEAVTILSNLNILKGYEDGTFKPDETVTRAEMAAIICRTLGYESQAESSKGTTVFNDVAGDHWASGYVNVAQAQGIINGYGNGQFGPEDKVTYEQAVKMIVSALGYDLVAAQKGGYPTGYLAVASAEGITKNANGKVGDPAKRSSIAILTYNSLEVRLMDQTSWSTGSDGDKYGKLDDTILSKYLEVDKYEGVVTATPATNTAGTTYDSTKKPEATIGSAKKVEYINGKLEKTAVSPQVAKAGKVDTDGLLGKYVVAYIGEDDATGDDTIFAIALNENKNTVTKLSATQLVDSDEKYGDAATTNTIGYKAIGSTKIQDLTVAAGAKVTKNFANVSSSDFTKQNTAELKAIVGRGGVIELICNDNDSEIEYINVISYAREAVVEKVKEANGVYKFDCYKGSLPRIDTEDKDKKYIIYKDGEVVDAKALAANDTINYFSVSSDDNYQIFYASSKTVTGAVSSYDTTENNVTIGGVDYDLSSFSGLTAAKLSGEEGTFYLNVDGQIAHNETAPTQSGKYAYALAVYDETTGVNTGSYIQVALADGTVAEYKISDTAKVVKDDNTDVAVNTASDKTKFKNYFASKMTVQSPATTFKTTVANAKANKDSLMVKLTVSGDKVTKAKLLPTGTSAVGNTSNKYDKDSNSLGALSFDDSTVVFAFKQTTGVIDPDDVKVGKVADFFVDDEDNYDVIAYDEDSSSVYGALVGFDLTSTISKDSAVFVVSSLKTTTYNNEDAYLVKGFVGGESKTITIYNKDGYDGQHPEDLVAGDAILISEPNAEGIVSDIKQLVDFAKGANASVAPTITVTKSDSVSALDQIYSGAGKLTAATSSKFTLDAAITDDATSSSTVFAAANEGISYKSNANYTLVDLSDNFKNPDVTIEDGSDYTFDTAYTTYAYVRVVDGKLKDVVVYRMAKAPATTPVACTSITASAANNATVAANQVITFTVNGAVAGATTNIVVNDPAKATASSADKKVTVASSVTTGNTFTVTVTVSAAGATTVTQTFTYTVG